MVGEGQIRHAASTRQNLLGHVHVLNLLIRSKLEVVGKKEKEIQNIQKTFETG